MSSDSVDYNLLLNPEIAHKHVYKRVPNVVNMEKQGDRWNESTHNQQNQVEENQRAQWFDYSTDEDLSKHHFSGFVDMSKQLGRQSEIYSDSSVEQAILNPNAWKAVLPRRKNTVDICHQLGRVNDKHNEDHKHDTREGQVLDLDLETAKIVTNKRVIGGKISQDPRWVDSETDEEKNMLILSPRDIDCGHKMTHQSYPRVGIDMKKQLGRTTPKSEQVKEGNVLSLDTDKAKQFIEHRPIMLVNMSRNRGRNDDQDLGLEVSREDGALLLEPEIARDKLREKRNWALDISLSKGHTNNDGDGDQNDEIEFLDVASALDAIREREICLVDMSRTLGRHNNDIELEEVEGEILVLDPERSRKAINSHSKSFVDMSRGSPRHVGSQIQEKEYEGDILILDGAEKGNIASGRHVGGINMARMGGRNSGKERLDSEEALILDVQAAENRIRKSRSIVGFDKGSKRFVDPQIGSEGDELILDPYPMMKHSPKTSKSIAIPRAEKVTKKKELDGDVLFLDPNDKFRAKNLGGIDMNLSKSTRQDSREIGEGDELILNLLQPQNKVSQVAAGTGYRGSLLLRREREAQKTAKENSLRISYESWE